MTENEERDEIIAAIPIMDVGFSPPGTKNALVYRNSAGELCIIPDTGGWLAIKPTDFGVMSSDIAPFSD